MITIFRLIRCWQIKIKWKFTLMHLFDKQATELLKNPEEIEKKFIAEIAKLIHENNELNKTAGDVFDAVNQKIRS